MAPELEVPPRPTRGISRAEDRAMLQAETAALAPWKQAMALDRRGEARGPRRPRRGVRRESGSAGIEIELLTLCAAALTAAAGFTPCVYMEISALSTSVRTSA